MDIFKEVDSNEKKYFDAKWYLEEYPDVRTAGVDPFLHYTRFGWIEGRNPSKYLNTKLYLDEYPEIILLNMNPLKHLEIILGDKTPKEVIFPKNCVEVHQELQAFDTNIKYNRVAIFASYFSDGIIPNYVLYYLEHLKQSCDAILFITDSPIISSELSKISSIVNYAFCARHQGYDFGSYKIGVNFLSEHLGLENIQELILCNDSCIAPITPFEEMFKNMQSNQSDFWGITASPEYISHIQSYFLAFRNSVIKHDSFRDFFNIIEGKSTRAEIIVKQELLLTPYFISKGFTGDSYIAYPDSDECSMNHIRHPNLTLAPRYLMKKLSPLIKLNSLTNKKLNFDGIESTIADLLSRNTTLGTLTVSEIKQMTQKSKGKTIPPIEVPEFDRLVREINSYYYDIQLNK